MEAYEIRESNPGHSCSLVAVTSFGAIAACTVAAQAASIGPHIRTVGPALATCTSAVPPSLHRMGTTRATGLLFVGAIG